MYSTEFAKGKKKKLDYKVKLDNKIVGLAPIVWAEHCLECAAPLCYGKCNKFRKRRDGRCQLFENSIVSVKDSNSLYGESIEVGFRGWAKLEADVTFKKMSIRKIKSINRNLKFISNTAVKVSSIFEKNKKDWYVTGKIYNFKEKLVRKYENIDKPDAFFLGVILENKEKSKIFFEIKDLDNIVAYRTSFDLNKGYNEFIIPFNELKIDYKNKYKVYLYNAVEELDVIFTMLDFVWLEKPLKEKKKKIKCVAWDLDNTLWDGVLIEGKVKLKDGIKEVIKSLDERGIINSIVSKNNHDDAMKKIKKLKLDEYFVMPQINWDPKSVNIERLAKQMNIGIDTIAFIDDNPFEREEVASIHPEVIIYDANEYLDLLNKKEFQVIVTEDTKKRRSTYKMLEKQNQEFEKFEGNIDEFLKQCKMKGTFRKPNENEYDRCYELIQRTNQLNLSGRRLTSEEILEMIEGDKYEAYLIKLEDKYGEYGIVGFSLVNIEKEPTITDFVISCRVANKKVEHTYFNFLAKKYKEKGYKNLFVNYVKTSKNGPMFKVVEEMKLKLNKTDGDFEEYVLDLTKDIKDIDIIDINEQK